MATCKECLCYEVCRADGNVFSHIISDHDVASDICPHFKDKTKYVEQKHGWWIEKPNPWGQDGSHSYDCSVCGERTCVVGQKLRYCPNCGAKMDLEE